MGWQFSRTDPEKEGFDIFEATDEISRFTKQSTKNTFIDKTWMKSLKLEYKSDNIIKWKAIEYIIKKILTQYD